MKQIGLNVKRFKMNFEIKAGLDKNLSHLLLC